MASNIFDQKTVYLSLTFTASGVGSKNSPPREVGSFEYSLTLLNRKEQREAVRRIKACLDTFIHRDRDFELMIALEGSHAASALRLAFQGAKSSVFRALPEEQELICAMSLNGQVVANTGLHRE